MDKTISMYLGYFSPYYAFLFTFVFLSLTGFLIIAYGWSFEVLCVAIAGAGILSLYFIKGRERLRELVNKMKKNKIFLA
ncbi:MAG: hypothetical protein NTZ13_05250 [Candidatus Parcubacteria bacterium]|nr:hypothetical protein [Candidatus Parcubacteria bacterium]